MTFVVLFECVGAPTSLVKRRVLDLPCNENGPSIDSLLSAAESRLGFKIERSVEWLWESDAPITVQTDRALTDLLTSLPPAPTVSQGCFRFTAATDSKAAPVPPPPLHEPSSCGGEDRSTSCCSDHLPDGCGVLDAASVTALSAQARDTIQVVLNGTPLTVQAPPSRLLVDWLREDQRLTGTKIGCGEGGCGACTVAVRKSGTSDPFVAINSCLRLLCACDGLDVLTTEGCGSDAKGFSSVQQAIADGNGSQCGYCTPGWVMNMEALLQQNPAPTRAQVEQQFDGNLCRCTGYRPILEAFKDLACGKQGEEEEEEAKVIECRLDLNHCGDMEDIAGCTDTWSSRSAKECAAVTAARSKKVCCKTSAPRTGERACTQRPSSSSPSLVHVVDRDSGDQYWAPSNLAELALVLAAQPNSSSSSTTSTSQFRIVSGNTAMGVAKYFNPDGDDDGAGNTYGQPPEGNGSSCSWTTVDVAKVREMRAIEGGGIHAQGDDDDQGVALTMGPFGLSVGASVPINELIAAIENHFILDGDDGGEGDEEEDGESGGKGEGSKVEGPRRRNASNVYSGVLRHLKRVANTQVRGSGSWGGNLTLVSKNQAFASDIALVLTALGVELEVLDASKLLLPPPPPPPPPTSDTAAATTAGASLAPPRRPLPSPADVAAATRRVSVAEWLSAAPGSKQVLVRGHFPSLLNLPSSSTHVWYSDKTAQRHVNSHPIASLACLLVLNRQEAFPQWRTTLKACVISPESRVVVGGVFSPAIRLSPEIVAAMQGGRIDRDLTLQKGLAAFDHLVLQGLKSKNNGTGSGRGGGGGHALSGEEGAIALSEDVQNSHSYRVALTRSFLYKTFLTANRHRLPHDLKSAAEPFAAAEDRPVSKGHQLFLVPDEESGERPVGMPVPKLSARLQASGEAKYASDQVNGSPVWGAFVLSPHSHAKLTAIDTSAALGMPGVQGAITARDIEGENSVGQMPRGSVFVEVGARSPYVGAPVGVVVADTMKRARAAAKAVKLTFASLCEDGDEDEDQEVEGGLLEEGARVNVAAAKVEFASSPMAARLRLRSRNATNTTTTASAAAASLRAAAAGGDGVSVVKGNPDAVFGSDAGGGGRGGRGGQVFGGVTMCGQRHFHLETHCTVAVPDEDRRISLTSGAQFPQLTQSTVAKVLGLPVHRVEVKARRVGGAYGAKITNNIFTAAAAAVTARKLNKTVLMHNERVDDMSMLGGREGMHFKYKVAFEPSTGGSDDDDSDTGKIQALDMFFEMDGATSPATSVGDLQMCIDWCDGCYYVPDFRALGDLRYSARPVNTSCRAPGNLQSITCRELVNEHVAFEVGLPLHVVQEKNLYSSGQVTPFGDEIGSSALNWTIPDLWQRCKSSSGFEARLEAAQVFNATNRFRKRGVAMVPTKYGMGPSEYKMGCLLNAFAADGTVEVFHSGVEIGQGINTKVAQAVAMALGIDLDAVIVGDASTAVIPNGGCTGGSGTSEACVGAALLACEQLNAVLAPFYGDDDATAAAGAAAAAAAGGGGGGAVKGQKGSKKSSSVSFAEAVEAASGAGLSLSTTGWFNVEKVSESGSFDYFSQGVGMAEVEIDCLTGEVQILRCDIHMDLGQSLNPAVDIGQVEGGFVMALGYMLTEEVLYNSPANRSGQAFRDTPGSAIGHSRDQVQINLGTWNYKIPSAFDIPQVLNVTLMPNTPNPSPVGVLGSKACGEPPMALAASVLLAIKQAVASCRKDALHRLRSSTAAAAGGGGGAGSEEEEELGRYVSLDLPLTVERIQQACKVSDTRAALRLHLH